MPLEAAIEAVARAGHPGAGDAMGRGCYGAGDAMRHKWPIRLVLEVLACCNSTVPVDYQAGEQSVTSVDASDRWTTRRRELRYIAVLCLLCVMEPWIRYLVMPGDLNSTFCVGYQARDY